MGVRAEINKKVSLIANFGAAYTGLATVGYKLWNGDGTQFQARTTTGVAEIRAGTGAYAVEVGSSVFTAAFDGYVEWDTGGGSPIYAYEDISITALLDTAISTRSTYAGGDTAGTTTLLSRLSATRAGYLDNLTNLDAAVSGIAAAVWAVSTRTLSSFGTLVADTTAAVWAAATRTLTAQSDSAGVTTLLSRLTSGRATNLDNLDAASSAIKAKTDLIPAGGPPSATDYTSARAAKIDKLVGDTPTIRDAE